MNGLCTSTDARNRRLTRKDVNLYTGNARCRTWLYLPAGEIPAQVIFMAHGLEGVRERHLPAYAQRFAE